MDTYKIKLHLPHTERKVAMAVKATDWESADQLAEALAGLMPEQEVYFDKNDEYITTGWCGNAEAV